jgi:CDP-paratose 2-epimerase
VRDALHPRDLAALVDAQIRCGRVGGQRIYTVGGGPENALSLAELNAACDARFGPHCPGSDYHPRPYDIPWMIMNSTCAAHDFGWRPEVPIGAILDEIADHARKNPDWLERSGL